MKKRKYLIPFFILAFVPFVSSCGGGSGGGEVTTEIAGLYLSPAGQPLNVGDTFTVEVTLDTDDKPVTAVSAYITFPSDLLEVDLIDITDSDFSVEAENNIEGNIIKITRGEATPGVNYINALIATIDFIAKAPGTARVSFQLNGSGAGPSRVIKDDGTGTDILTTVMGETYTIQP